MSRVTEIINEVCRRHGVARHEIEGAQQSLELVLPRHEAFYRLRTELRLSLNRIGQILGGFDHSSVIHGIGRHYAVLNDLPTDAKSYGCRTNKIFREYCSSVTAEVELRRKSQQEDVEAQKRVARPKSLPISTPRRSMFQSRFDRLVRENARYADFVLEWIADGGTPSEALEPYGFCRISASQFVREYLPELFGLHPAERRKRAYELWYGEEVAA